MIYFKSVSVCGTSLMWFVISNGAVLSGDGLIERVIIYIVSQNNVHLFLF